MHFDSQAFPGGGLLTIEAALRYERRFPPPVQFIHRRLLSWLGFIPVAAAFVAMTVLSWRKWGDVIVDFGTNLYVPWQITEGRLLYSDIDWLFGPLSQYYHALLFKCFGVSLTPLILSSLCLTAICAIVVYLLFLRAADEVNAIAVCLVLLVVFAFPQLIGNGNYNYICPYSYEAVHGVFASIGVIGFLVLWFPGKKALYACAAGFFFGLVFLTKPEIFVAVAMAAAVAFLIGKGSLRCIAAFILCAVIPVAGFAVYFCGIQGVHDGLQSTFWNWNALFVVPISGNKFYLWGFGLDEPWKNTVLMFRYFGGLALVVLATFFCCRPGPRPGGLRKIVSTIALLALFIGASRLDWMQSGRCLPLLAPMICVHLLWRRWKCGGPDASRDLLFPILWSVFGCFLLAKMGVNSRIWHYGFVLAMPASLSVVYYLGYFLPGDLKRFGVNVFLFRGVMYVMLASGVFSLLDRSVHFYRLRDFPVGENGDTTMMFDPAFDPTGKDLVMVLDWLGKNAPAGSTFVSIPHGLGINYLARHADPVRYTEFIPHILETYGVENIKARMIAAHPDYIVLVHVDTSEHGARFFGDSPASGAEIMRWINETYTPVFLAGQEPLQTEAFGIKILQRRQPGNN